MKKRVKKIMLGVTLFVVVIFILGVVYFFFGAKKHTFYMPDNLGEIQAVKLQVEENGNKKLVFIYNKDIINQVLDRLETVKMKPTYDEYVKDHYDFTFNIYFWGEDKQSFGYSASVGESVCVMDTRVQRNGKIDNGMKNFISLVSISKEEGSDLYDFTKKIIEENLRNITISELEDFSHEKLYDWNKFQQYFYEDTPQQHVKVRNGISSAATAKFPIEGKKGYVLVWYYNGIIVNENGTNEYHEVCDAVVYTEQGEEMNLYEDGIGTFLEEME